MLRSSFFCCQFPMPLLYLLLWLGYCPSSQLHAEYFSRHSGGCSRQGCVAWDLYGLDHCPAASAIPQHAIPHNCPRLSESHPGHYSAGPCRDVRGHYGRHHWLRYGTHLCGQLLLREQQDGGQLTSHAFNIYIGYCRDWGKGRGWSPFLGVNTLPGTKILFVEVKCLSLFSISE